MFTERENCAGCGHAFAASELVAGELATWWCGTCVAESPAARSVVVIPRGALRAGERYRLPPEHRAHPAYDRIQEDDGEP